MELAIETKHEKIDNSSINTTIYMFCSDIRYTGFLVM